MENSQALSVREIGVITAEIKEICHQAQSMALLYAVEIGRRLVEAKQAIPHGAWGDWLKDEVEFSQRSANNFMKIYEEYSGELSNSQALANLSYTKALELLAVPREEREEFVKDANVEDLSARQLREVIAERDRLLRDVEEARQSEERMSQSLASAEISLAQEKIRSAEIDKLKADLEKADKDREASRKKIDKLKDELRRVEENPQISDDAKEKIRAEMSAEIERRVSEEQAKEVEDLRKRIAEAEEKAKKAIEGEQTARDEIGRLQGAARFANPKMAEFKVLFESVQKDVFRLREVIEEIAVEDAEAGKKLRMALMTFADSFGAG